MNIQDRTYSTPLWYQERWKRHEARKRIRRRRFNSFMKWWNRSIWLMFAVWALMLVKIIGAILSFR